MIDDYFFRRWVKDETWARQEGRVMRVHGAAEHLENALNEPLHYSELIKADKVLIQDSCLER